MFEHGINAARRANRHGLQKGAALLLSTLLFASAVHAQAQTYDWLVNIDDDGFEETPAGGDIAYTIDITNNGPDSAPAGTLNFNVPAGTTFVSATAGANGLAITGCAPSAAGYSCNIPPLADQQIASLIAQFRTSSAGVATLVARIPDADAVLANNDLSENTTIVAGSDIALTMTAPATAASGSFVNFDLIATNNGPNAANNFTVDFVIPTGLVNVTPPAGCSLANGIYSCLIPGPVATGQTTALQFRGQISAAGGSTVSADSSVNDSDPSDPIASNNLAKSDIAITGGTDVALTKSRTPTGTLLLGNTVTFTLNAQYTGDSPENLRIFDSIPSNYAIQSVTPSAGSGWACTTTGQDVDCLRPSGNGPGGNVSLGQIVVVAQVVSGGAPENIATISTTSPDGNAANNTASDGGATINAPFTDLRANKAGGRPNLGVVGQLQFFRLSATNIGNVGFVGTLRMVDTLPAGLDLSSVSTNGWTCTPSVPPAISGPVDVTCSRIYTAAAPLAPGATTPQVNISALVTAPGTITNSVTVSSPDAQIPDLNPSNDTATYTLESSLAVDSADIYALKRAVPAPPATVVSGEPMTFELEIANRGPAVSQNINVVDVFRNLINANVGAGNGFEQFTIAENAASGVSCYTNGSGTTRVMGCEIASLPICTPGVDCPVITAVVRPGGNAGSYSNSFTATSAVTPDPSNADNTASATYQISAFVDVTVAKTANPDPVIAGQNLEFTVTATNLSNGLSAADNVTITDSLPADMTFISATPSTGSCGTTPAVGSVTAPGNDQVTCNLGTIANGSQQTVRILVRPNNAVRNTQIENAVVVTTTTPEANLTNNSANVQVEVENPILDLRINKTDSIDPVAVGEDTVYTLTVTNGGPSASENVIVTDVMPTSKVAYQSHTVSGLGTCGTVPTIGVPGGILECTWPTLAAGASEVVQITVRGVEKGAIKNNVSIDSDEISTDPALNFDTQAANNATEENTTVRTRTDVEVVSKIATPANVFLRDDFVFEVLVRVNSTGGLLEADDVRLTDNLPANMQLVGTPTAAIQTGTATANSCTGTAGGTGFTCDFGTVSSPGEILVTIPVEVTQVSSGSQTFDNTASVTTSSLDIDPSNNSATGSVSVGSSSLSGTIFRDFADDGLFTAGDTLVSGVLVTLTGTSFDGQPITRTTTTDANGDYAFVNLPAGTYTVTRDTVAEPYLVDGVTTPGPIGAGSVTAPTTIGNIALPANTAAPDNDFALIPLARVGIAKQASVPVQGSDGTFTSTITLLVENFSTEPLINVAVTDPMQGAAPSFGTFASLAAPSTDTMAPGTYTIIAAPTGSCGGTNAGFNGAGTTSVASGISLPVGATCELTFGLRIKPLTVASTTYINQATVTATGAISGQTQANNPNLRDLSDDGVDPDPNGNAQAGDAGENNPTPLAVGFDAGIALIKTADTSGLSLPIQSGDVITYSFAIRNTGSLTLSNVTVTDNLPGIVITGGPIASLAPGETDDTTFTATYAVSTDDVNAGEVINTAIASGLDPFGNTVIDNSGASFTTDTPTRTPLQEEPAIAIIKTADTSALQSPARPGDVISYGFTVINTGNVTLTNVRVTDPLTGLVLTGSPIGSLAPAAQDSTSYSATYALTQADILAGGVTNQATATGTPPSGTDVTDLSGTEATTDDPTVVTIAQTPAIALDKVADAMAIASGASPGDTISYTFSVTNTGNIPLSNVVVTDALPGAVMNGGPILQLDPGETDSQTFTASYALTATDIASGILVNTATAEGFFGPGNGQSVTASDVETVQLTTIEAVSEVFPAFTTNGGTTTSMLASDLLAGGPATLDNVTIRVLATDPGVTLDPATGLITLAPGLPAGSYQVEYEICSIAQPGLCDTAIETVVQSALPALETTKTQVLTDNGDNIDGAGDTLTYTITVENIGNVPVTDLGLTDTLTDRSGAQLTLSSGPDFVTADAGSAEGDLNIGETATYTANYVITAQDVLAEGVDNTVLADALAVFGPDVPGTPGRVRDVSDDGDDTDGNIVDDPTQYDLIPGGNLGAGGSSGITLVKTTPRTVITRGSTVPYQIVASNSNASSSEPLRLVDSLPTGFVYVPQSATLNGAPANVTVTAGTITWEGVTIPGNGSVTLALSARALTGAGAGDHVNRADAISPTTGLAVTPTASATVSILPEAVFDCGDVIGKVFEDHNGNGYQDDVRQIGRAAITDQTYDTGKGGKLAPEPETLIERGIPGVRLATVDGTVITTDANGLYNVPCAMLPAAGGSNFILKLDERTLPSGYRMTTENPRAMRLTPGMLTEMNFGAAIGRVAVVDINGMAFAGGQPSDALKSGLRQLLSQIAGEPVNIRLAFHVPANASAADVSAARQLMDITENYIRTEWRSVGREQLRVEQTIVRNGQ